MKEVTRTIKMKEYQVLYTTEGVTISSKVLEFPAYMKTSEVETNVKAMVEGTVLKITELTEKEVKYALSITDFIKYGHKVETEDGDIELEMSDEEIAEHGTVVEQ